MRLAFAGTPEFARVALAALFQAGHEVPLVLTQPDRPAGRGMKRLASPVKQQAVQQGARVIQPAGLRLDGRHGADAQAAREALVAAAPDLMVVAAYGLILPDWVLALPRLGCLNIHASLLPRWRGAAPIQRALEAGDAETGVALMRMEAGLDTGPVHIQQALAIAADDTAATLHDKLAALGAGLLVRHLPDIAAGQLPARPQAAGGVSYAAKIDKSEAHIDWSCAAEQIERRLRAFDPFPGCSFVVEGETIKAWRGRCVEASGPAGEVLSAGDELVVACGHKALALGTLQRQGGRRLPAGEVLRARPLAPGMRLA
jgi:methionyl-tRNA formyltransferase